MAKTRFSEEKRSVVLVWMMEQYDEKNKDALNKPKAKAISAINAAIRKKYPEADMAVLRKYDATRRDRCLRFVDGDTNQFFGFDFGYGNEPEDLADVPIKRGCTNNDVFVVTPTGRKSIEAYAQALDKAKAERNQKLQDYRSFLFACRHVEDAHEVVPFPEDMQRKLFSGAAVIAVNDELIASIKTEFAA